MPAMVGATSVAARGTVADAPTDTPPADQTPVDHIPIVGPAVTEIVIDDTDPADTPVDDTLDADAPSEHASAADTAVVESPPDDTQGAETAVDDESPEEAPADAASLAGAAVVAAAAADTGIGQTPPADDTPADPTPADETAAVGAAAAHTAVEEAPPDAAPAPPPPTTDTDTNSVLVPPRGVDEEAPEADPSQRFVWLIPALIAAAAVIVIALFGLGFLDDTTEATAAPEPVASPVPTTTAQTTTTQAPTTTAAPTTTTSTTIAAPASIESVGNAIPMSSLTLKAGGIGPLVIGDPASDAMGRLVASLGRPEETGVADEELGLCPGEDGRFVRWAGLKAVVAGTLEEGVFAGYRFEEQAVPTMHLDLATPSGLRVGDPVSTLNEVYATYQIDYVSDGGTSLFRLFDGEGLLLWGPVSSIEATGRVEGIHSPDACSS